MSHTTVKRAFIMSIPFLSIFCGNSSPQSAPVSGRIHIEVVRSDRPAFERVYTATVGDGFRIEVKRRWFLLSDRFSSASITQRGGRWMTFDVDAVADKIIDRELYPLVQAAVDEILAADSAYVSPEPDEFTDKRGVRWRKVTATGEPKP